MKIYYHSGGCGDLIYGLKAIAQLGPGVLYTGLTKDRHEAIEPFLRIQKNIVDVIHAPEFCLSDKSLLGITHDLDLFRTIPVMGKKNLVLCHLEAFNLDTSKWQKPWLNTYSYEGIDYALINRTERYNDPSIEFSRLSIGISLTNIPIHLWSFQKQSYAARLYPAINHPALQSPRG